MRIRGRLLKMLDCSVLTQPEAPQSRSMLSLPPPPPKFMLAPPPSTHAPSSFVALADSNIPTAATEMVCMLNYQWGHQHDALDPKLEELNSAPIGSPWREPRAEPGLAYTTEVSSMEVQTEGKIGKKVTKIHVAPKKMKQGGNDYKKNRKTKKGKVLQKDVLNNNKVVNHFRLQEKTTDGKWRCKKNDRKNWQCMKPTTKPNSLCYYHLRRKSSTSKPEEATRRANAKLATEKALATIKSAPMKASAKSKSALVKTLARSKAGPVSAASRSKATASVITLPSSRKPRKKVDYDFSRDFYYYDLFTPFRAKQRGNYSSNKIVEAVANVEEKKSPQEDITAEAREEDCAAIEAQGQGYNPPDDALDSDNIDEIVKKDEESDDDYCAPLADNSKSRVKNLQRKVHVSDLNCPNTGMKRFKSL